MRYKLTFYNGEHDIIGDDTTNSLGQAIDKSSYNDSVYSKLESFYRFPEKEPLMKYQISINVENPVAKVKAARALIDSASSGIFYAFFTKKDGVNRKINCRRYAAMDIKGTSKYNVEDVDKQHGHITVFDMINRNYRKINLNTLMSLTVNGISYTFNDVSDTDMMHITISRPELLIIINILRDECLRLEEKFNYFDLSLEEENRYTKTIHRFTALKNVLKSQLHKIKNG